jgi:hypothetical protein
LARNRLISGFLSTDCQRGKSRGIATPWLHFFTKWETLKRFQGIKWGSDSDLRPLVHLCQTPSDGNPLLHLADVSGQHCAPEGNPGTGDGAGAATMNIL